MSTVYVLIHDDLPDGGYELRGVYATEKAARDSLITLTEAGEPTHSMFAHDRYCCYVEQRPVLSSPQIDVRKDDPPIDPNSPFGQMLKQAVDAIEAAAQSSLRVGPFRILTAEPTAGPDRTPPT